MKIGLYFGSFNPIHTGHLIIASHVANHTDLQKVWFVVSPQNPFKHSATLLNEYQRLKLVQLAVEDDEQLKASDIEFKLPRPSYTIDETKGGILFAIIQETINSFFMFHVKQQKIIILFVFFFCFSPTIYSQEMNQVWLEKKEVPLFHSKDNTIETWNKQNYRLYSKLSAEGKEWLYWINYSRKNPSLFWEEVVVPYLKAYPYLSKGGYATSLKRTLLKTQQVPLLTLDDRLIRTSQEHANDISENNISPGHNSSNGDSFANRMTRAGIGSAAENISVGNHSIVLSLILLYLDIDIPSLGHRKNLLNLNYTKIGIGTSLLSDGSLFTVQDFAVY